MLRPAKGLALGVELFFLAYLFPEFYIQSSKNDTANATDFFGSDIAEISSLRPTLSFLSLSKPKWKIIHA